LSYVNILVVIISAKGIVGKEFNPKNRNLIRRIKKKWFFEV
jgi:hypothetical protein